MKRCTQTLIIAFLATSALACGLDDEASIEPVTMESEAPSSSDREAPSSPDSETPSNSDSEAPPNSDSEEPSSSEVESITITVNGLSRNFIVAAPSSGRASSAVIVFHGGRGTAERAFSNNSIATLAPSMGALAVFPNAIDKNWTDGRITTSEGPDDVAFTRAMIAELSSRYGVDPDRVFGAGISNGAMFTHKMACDAPGVLRAIAPVAGNMSEALLEQCDPASGAPVMIFNGTEDPLMPYDGGRPELDQYNTGQDQLVSTNGTADFWAARNGCGAPDEMALPETTDDGTSVTRITYACSGDAVVIYRVEGGGHTWPGSTGSAPAFAGPISEEIDASALMLEFFSGYGL